MEDMVQMRSPQVYGGISSRSNHHIKIKYAMIKHILVIALVFGFSFGLSAQTKTTKTENIVFITLDGLRWQEVFRGAEEALMTFW